MALAALGYWADVIAGSHAAQPLAPAALCASFFSAGAFNIAAWAMVAVRFLQPQSQSQPFQPVSAILAITVLVSSLLCVVPIAFALAPGLMLLGLGLFLHPALPAKRRQAGLLLLGLGITWGWPFLRFAHGAVGRLDAQVVGAILHFSGLHVRVQGNVIGSGNFGIEVLPACASSFPIAEVVLAYVLVAVYSGRRLSKADLPWLVASVLFSLMLTEIRLSLMVSSWADWNWWHNGPGVSIYELVALAGAVFFPLMAARPFHGRKALAA